MSKLSSKGLPVGVVFIVALVLWLASGIFIVKPGEVGVITAFGKFSREVIDGPHYHLPYPIEQAEIVVAEPLRTMVIGQTLEGGRTAAYKSGSGKSTAEEASMFTGDENIVHLRFNVQYNISEPNKFLFNVRDPENTIKIASEAAMREVVGRSMIDNILTSGRTEIQIETLQVLENILRPYDMGVKIHTVQLLDAQPPPDVEAAFKDVASAREDRVRRINEAEAYRMQIVPVANGTAQSMLNAAQGYSRQVEESATGEARRFMAMVDEFNKARDVSKKRMYLDAMNELLSAPGLQKIVLSKDAGSHTLPLLNLDPSAPSLRNLPKESALAREVKQP